MIRSPADHCFRCLALVAVAAAIACTTIRADEPADPVRMVLDLLANEDADDRRIGLDGVRYGVKGSAATYRIAAILSTLPPIRQAELIAALADRGDAAAIPAITARLLAAPEPKVRTGAIRALGVLGTGTEVALLKKYLSGEEPDRTTARRALVAVRGADVGKQLAEAAKYGDASLRPTFIAILAERRERAVAPDLLTLAGDTDPAIRVAALRALAEIGGPAEIGGLVDLLLRGTAASDRGETEKVIVAICTTNRGHAESAAALLERFKAAAEPERDILLPTLRSLSLNPVLP